MGKASRKSQSPCPNDSESIASKFDMKGYSAGPPKPKKVGRYTEHIRPGVGSVGVDPTGPHSLRDNLNENSQMIDHDGQNKGSKTQLPRFQMKMGVPADLYNTQRVMNEYSSAGLEDATRSEDPDWGV